MGSQGVRITTVGSKPIADDVLVLREGSVGRQPITDLSLQLSGQGPLSQRLARAEVMAGFGAIYVSERQDLDDVEPVDKQGAWVLNDPIAANNGIWSYDVSSGEWLRVAGLPVTLAILINVGGTADAVTADTEPGVDPSEVKMLSFTPLYTNAGAATLEVNGAEPVDLLNATGTALQGGELVTGVPMMLIADGDDWRIAFPANVVSQVQGYAEAAADSGAMAEQWAEEDEDVEVEPGLFSAKHWAKKAQAATDPVAFADLTDKAEGTGTYSTFGSFVAHRGTGSIALVANDGYGNANVAFNHYLGTPDVTGNAGRIEVNVDDTANEAYFRFSLKSGVTEGEAGALNETLTFDENDITFKYNAIFHEGNVHSNFDLINGTFTGTTVASRAESFVVAPSGYAPTYDDGSRGPLFIWNNVDPNDIPAGKNAGIQVVIGANPQATPGAGDVVAQTITIDNLNNREVIWGMNILALQNAAGKDGIVRGIELEVANAMSAADDPFSNANVRKHGIVLQGHSGSLYSPSSALNIVANGTTEEKFWSVGIGLSRCKNSGLKFVKDPFGATDTDAAFQIAAIYDASDSANVLKVDGSHSNIIDLSGATSPGDFVKGLSGAATTLVMKNDADYSMTLALDSGKNEAQSAFLTFRDRGSEKWRVVKNSGNDFAIFNILTNKSSIFIDNVDDEVTLAGGLYWSPGASETPTVNGQVTTETTSDTSLTFKLKGSDGIVRGGSVALTPL